MKHDKTIFVLCINNKDADDLQVRKVYQTKPDEKTEKDGYIRIINDSGEDYLYPKSYFINIQLPKDIQDAILINK